MLSDGRCCQTVDLVRQAMLSDRRCCQTADVVRQSIWSDNRAILVMKFQLRCVLVVSSFGNPDNIS